MNAINPDLGLYVAEQIVAYYWQQMRQIDKDNEYYEQTDELLRSAYNYAQDRYKSVQQKLFVEGQGNYFKTLARFPFRTQGRCQEPLQPAAEPG